MRQTEAFLTLAEFCPTHTVLCVVMDGAGGADAFCAPQRPARSRSGCQADADAAGGKAAIATLCERRGQHGSVLLARESLEPPKPASLGLVLWKVRKVLMEKREQEEQSRAGTFFFLLICCFFFFRKLQFVSKCTSQWRNPGTSHCWPLIWLRRGGWQGSGMGGLWRVCPWLWGMDHSATSTQCKSHCSFCP